MCKTPTAPAFQPVSLDGRTLHVPRRSGHVPAETWAVPYNGPIPDHWQKIARAKGFHILARVRDRYHLALECRVCGAVTAQKIFTLRTAQPACAGCAENGRRTTAQEAGLVYLGRDPEDRHYGRYRIPECGHEVRRQFEIIERAAAGETAIRCETCLQAREEDEARRQGWTRLGPDPLGNPSYRLYRHDACGHEQRVAVANMYWGQCDCAICGESWTAKASTIYLARIALPRTGRTVLKLGYSAHPEKRFRHQLGLPEDAQVTFLRLLAMPTGHAACAAEKRAHAELGRRFPQAVIPPKLYAGQINVVTEIYAPWLLSEIERVLNRIARDIAAPDGARPG
ncbi:hypothetical protein SAMN05444722_0038 [Rhodovulum sp. ES.010]|uniref:hypothetical protein n=1 Tax=Rhodovulum sp. ES.010 TaxID=1882821 RepID=UPI00092C5BCF|nr:hypothetical protein [Rhodovulum sp. ES.010]SIN99259.1 hypothetical protein SAMN05444722_0038 [Rhodovulum sp. ES.010]